ncbi:MAG TPA: hypothetical protein VFV99_14935 [Kofleriaceae bacterium]|nr:hypothetical protein [Kofleriaceae bacterium]
MGARSLIGLTSLAALGFGACGRHQPPATPEPAKPASTPEKVVADFEQSVKTSKDAYVGMFDFVAVGEFEILLHRYDLNGRLKNLPDDMKQQFAAEDGTPYPPERERRNVGNFYTFLAQRTVGTGGCTLSEPRTHYGKLLGVQFDPLPEGTSPGYEKLRTTVNAYLAKGGVVGIRCSGGNGGLALVWTERPNQRGYDLITIYDD